MLVSKFWLIFEVHFRSYPRWRAAPKF